MNLKPLALSAYLVGMLLILLPFGEAILSTQPFTPTSLPWRYGATGIMSSALLTPMLGLLLIAMVAALLEHRRVLRTAAVLSLAAAVVLLAASGLFALDAIQLRAQVIPAARGSFQTATALTFLRIIALIVTAGVLGLAAWKASRPLGRSSKKGGPAPLLRRGRSSEPVAAPAETTDSTL